MLIILYGATAEMGFKSREYLVSKGFQLVEKYYYASNTPKVTTLFGKRNFVSELEFMENTDSLFRYEVGGMMAGFNQQQISDAVCNRTNCLLTLSTKDIYFLSEIKKVYAENVCLVYAYIDDATLKQIVANLSEITEEEAKVRLETGRDIKQSYLQYRHIFDHVVIYGGEESEFDYQSLCGQFESILDRIAIKKIAKSEKETPQYADVFISYTKKDIEIYNQMRAALIQQGVSVFDDRQLSSGTKWTAAIETAIQNAKIFIPIITNNSFSSEWTLHEVDFALECAEKSGSLIVPVFDDKVDLDRAQNLKEKLELLSCVLVENEQVLDVANQLAERIYKLLSAETYLKAYARQVENYLFLKMYEQAKCSQEAHLALCIEIYALTNGCFMFVNCRV